MTYVDSKDWRKQISRLEGAYASSTIKAYYTDMSCLVDWCARHKIEWRVLTPRQFCEYLDWLAARGLKFGSIERKLYAARRLFTVMEIRDPTRGPEVDLAMRRLRRSSPTRPQQARGISGSEIARFIDVQPDTPWGLRNRAILSLGYDLLARRSELTALATGDVVWRADGTLEVIVRRSKSDQFGSGRIAFTSLRSADCVGAWLKWRGPDITPLFCGIYRGRAIDRPISGDTVKRIVKLAAAACGYDAYVVQQFSAHSLRVGAAQQLLQMGHDGAAIMRAGGWKSTATLGRYLSHADHNVWLRDPACRHGTV
ncbi:tyrosine-type recombinase/integrase [Rhodobacteraceae bacterium XHP0102]|nr:tyrosine-type recombinase/integrase [Rhodobacteraceae bacterium XHP0102]